MDAKPDSEEVIDIDEAAVSGMLIRLWEDILDVQGIDASDDFFAFAGYSLGGQSLLATYTATVLSRELRIPIPVRLIYEHPVLGELAAEVTSRLRDHAGE